MRFIIVLILALSSVPAQAKGVDLHYLGVVSFHQAKEACAAKGGGFHIPTQNELFRVSNTLAARYAEHAKSRVDFLKAWTWDDEVLGNIRSATVYGAGTIGFDYDPEDSGVQGICIRKAP